jgi:hypothetical protein
MDFEITVAIANDQLQLLQHRFDTHGCLVDAEGVSTLNIPTVPACTHDMAQNHSYIHNNPLVQPNTQAEIRKPTQDSPSRITRRNLSSPLPHYPTHQHQWNALTPLPFPSNTLIQHSRYQKPHSPETTSLVLSGMILA